MNPKTDSDYDSQVKKRKLDIIYTVYEDQFYPIGNHNALQCTQYFHCSPQQLSVLRRRENLSVLLKFGEFQDGFLNSSISHPIFEKRK